jgi:hypothetical protein
LIYCFKTDGDTDGDPDRNRDTDEPRGPRTLKIVSGTESEVGRSDETETERTEAENLEEAATQTKSPAAGTGQNNQQTGRMTRLWTSGILCISDSYIS